MSTTWIVLGATSTIARHFARLVAAKGDGLILAGRDMEELRRSAADGLARGAPLAEAMAFDARDPASFDPLLDRLRAIGGSISVAVFVGSMPSQEDIDADPSLVDGTVTDSFTGPARFLTAVAPILEERGMGTVVGVGSVAGDRGRLGNYVYGASKAGFHAYLSGLRNRLGRSGVHVVTVKPGTVDTAMTWGMDKLPFLAPPEKVAADILRAVERRTDVLYTPFIWWPVMTVIRAIPERIFKKMKI
ncbi:SDR family NAD(P)-dependent oxidoreductase [Silicimonas algicola]|uniref:Short-subunit dehydrogenase n=1 Tax=Silicimonas algicola TaxID=1826607 RepID=A0A316GCR6_9RHOB|nr:SDR family NAD(P)-dependent oxidoreductase [Silicimonas algicola]AZQ66172.1 SDR family NAD(P)-dependent oxidoreductase [Silicimonas algicola]PWK58482.1 short-subunit dehydrogenase [Silicimonas algicola]